VIQPLTEMSNRMSPRSKGGRCVELITFSLSCADRPEIPGAPRAVQTCNGVALPFA